MTRDLKLMVRQEEMECENVDWTQLVQATDQQTR